MAAPNLTSLSDQKIQSAELAPTTSLADLIPAVPSGHAYYVEQINVANIHATAPVVVDVTHYIAASGNTRYLCKRYQISRTQGNKNILNGRGLMMAEGDYLQALTASSSTAEIVAPYVDFS